ncbi:hypothetical protein LMG18101_00499 [Ralstonia flaminis]|jgi:hypothetical protein|uniref:Uncharacterized protein n=1 Tax=Ralstonia flaminis TaxID=3058597 RepID=A0ABN9JHA8_9RALS|nr:hypothetical protein LMG18101_00499 [Ralstonia sp. LMG 18101]
MLDAGGNRKAEDGPISVRHGSQYERALRGS